MDVHVAHPMLLGLVAVRTLIFVPTP